MRTVFVLLLAGCLVSACSVSNQLQKAAQRIVLQDSALQTAHVGISIYEPATGKWWYNWQDDKYFIPASNVKIATCYVAMKYLRDSLPASKIAVDDRGYLRVFPSGDPSFLHPEFPFQPLFQKMKQYKTILWSVDSWKSERWGSGWSWSDYDVAYMAERSPLPVYGNVATFYLAKDTLKMVPSKLPVNASAGVGYSKSTSVLSSSAFKIERGLDDYTYDVRPSNAAFSPAKIPLRTDAGFVSELLEDTLKAEVVFSETAQGYVYRPETQTIYSQPTDSLLRPMMHRSDNFFAEQALLMVSNEVLGYMSDESIIDTLLKTDFRDLPQQPRWVDGSGLSRYNLFTPQDFVSILHKVKEEFGMKRIKEVFASGNEGTLAGYYKNESPYLYAKTGTLSGVVALSGFLTTGKGKELIFSILVNNHRSGALEVRRVMEKFLQNLRNEH